MMIILHFIFAEDEVYLTVGIICGESGDQSRNREKWVLLHSIRSCQCGQTSAELFQTLYQGLLLTLMFSDWLMIHKVDDIKCKTTYKTSFTTKMETQCTPTFDTSCSTVLQTAYKQDCKTIPDVECRIVNIDKHGKYTPKVRLNLHSNQNNTKIYFQKICTDVPTQKCIPIPVKVEAEKCVNIPTQSCENVPVVASVPVPSKQCFRKPR